MPCAGRAAERSPPGQGRPCRAVVSYEAPHAREHSSHMRGRPTQSGAAWKPVCRLPVLHAQPWSNTPGDQPKGLVHQHECITQPMGLPRIRRHRPRAGLQALAAPGHTCIAVCSLAVPTTAWQHMLRHPPNPHARGQRMQQACMRACARQAPLLCAAAPKACARHAWGVAGAGRAGRNLRREARQSAARLRLPKEPSRHGLCVLHGASLCGYAATGLQARRACPARCLPACTLCAPAMRAAPSRCARPALAAPIGSIQLVWPDYSFVLSRL